MPDRAHLVLAVLLGVVGWTGPLAAQPPFVNEPLHPARPLRPLTEKDKNHREALYQFTLGVLCEREDRLIEAATHFDKAAELDPDAVPVLKSLLALQFALERTAEASVLIRRILELAPDDPATWHLHARQLRAEGKTKEAIKALERALATKVLHDQTVLAQHIYFDLGGLHETEQRPVSAAEAFGAAAALLEHPDNVIGAGLFRPQEIAARCAEAYERMGRNWLKAKRFDDALSAFRKAQASHPDGAIRLNLDLARVCLEQGDTAQAVESLNAYLRLLPQDTEAYEMKIALLRKLKRGDEVLPWLGETAARDRFNLGLQLLLARELGQGGQLDKAEAIYKEQAAQTPTATIYRGYFQLLQANPKRGLHLLNQTLTVAMRKDDPAANAGKGQARAMIAALREDKALAKTMVDAGQAALKQKEPLAPDTLQLLAALASQQRQYDQAANLYRACLKTMPAELEPLVYGGLLDVLWKQRKYQEIADLCVKGLDRAKAADQVVFYTHLARAHACLGETAAALRDVDKALALKENGEKLPLRLLRGRLLIQGERFAPALEECQAMLKDYPLPADEMEVRYLLSSIYSQQKNIPKAEQELQVCLKIDPNNATVNNDLGYLWADHNKNLERAEEMIRKALELDKKQRASKSPFAVETDAVEGENAAYIDSLGWVLYRRGKLREARGELERACAMPDGDDPVLWDHLGDVYRDLEMRHQAVEAWQRALELCDQDKRRKMDDRKRELERKIKLLVTQGPTR